MQHGGQLLQWNKTCIKKRGASLMCNNQERHLCIIFKRYLCFTIGIHTDMPLYHYSITAKSMESAERYGFLKKVELFVEGLFELLRSFTCRMLLWAETVCGVTAGPEWHPLCCYTFIPKWQRDRSISMWTLISLTQIVILSFLSFILKFTS